MSRTFGRFKASALLVVLAGYLVLNYPFMQLRILPTGFGIPLGELFDRSSPEHRPAACTVAHERGRIPVSLPCLVSWGLGGFVFDTMDQGFGALRDSTQLLESLFLVAGFILAGQPGMMARLIHWLRPIIVISCLYGLLFVFADDIAAMSPTLPGASDQAIPIFALFATTGTILLWGASCCMKIPLSMPRNGQLIPSVPDHYE